MKIRRSLIGVTCGIAAILASVALLAPHAAHAARQSGKKKVLVVSVTKGFRHGSIAMAERTIEEIGKKTGEWDTDFVRTDEDMQTKMTGEALKQYDAVVFANTTGDLPLPDPKAFYDYIKAGHGFAAMHSGSDTLHSKDNKVSDYVDMLGGEFQEHHTRSTIKANIEDPNNPATRALVAAGKHTPNPLPSQHEIETGHSYVAGKTWTAYDEIYLLKNNDRTKVHVLLSMDTPGRTTTATTPMKRGNQPRFMDQIVRKRSGFLHHSGPHPGRFGQWRWHVDRPSLPGAYYRWPGVCAGFEEGLHEAQRTRACAVGTSGKEREGLIMVHYLYSR